MSLTPGTKLGPYEIIAPLGAGGMGEVYKAQDTRLERTVAIKVLPSHLSTDPDLQQRFEREARAVSSLNHPHICTLHDIGREGDVDFLVMEHLEGESLAERLKKGPLPLSEALRYAVEIADALDKAHRQGVVHRDLKPGNIMLTKSGAKLLDFGLAKVAGTASSPDVATLSSLPTEQKSLTAAGTILGTFQYMAPEQIEGGDVDTRTDIFALGAVIYEMVTGKKAFEGKSQASLIGAIMRGDPPAISAVQPVSPRSLDWTVKRCLAKDPEDRWQSARDLMVELERIEQGGEGEAAAATTAPSRSRDRFAWMAAGLLLGAVLTVFVFSAFQSPEPSSLSPRITRFVLHFAADEIWGGGGLDVSPDGSMVAYVASRGNNQQLYLRRLDQLESRPMEGTDGASSPFFSHDGQWVGFYGNGKLQKVSVNGGLPLTLCDSPETRGASWGPDDRILFATIAGELFQVPAGGGTAEPLEPMLDDQHDTLRFPHVLPDGSAALVSVRGADGGRRVAVLSMESGEIHTLVESGDSPHYVPTGHLLYSQSGRLMAVPFDLERQEITGSPVPIIDDVGLADFGTAEDGTLVYATSRAFVPNSRLVWVDRQGRERILMDTPRQYIEPRVSPDGSRLAVTLGGGPEYDIWIHEFDRGTLSRLTFTDANDSLPVWTPDGRNITYCSNSSGAWSIYSVPSDGSGEPTLLTNDENQPTGSSWSPDGQFLAVTLTRPGTGVDVGIVSKGDEENIEIFLGTPFDELHPIFSPDGRWLAYTSDESGHPEVYVRSFPGPGRKWQISTEGGMYPLWAPNGRELFYRNGNKMMAVSLAGDSELRPGVPAVLFEASYHMLPLAGANMRSYDVSRDGQQFVMIKPIEEESRPTQVHVVLNWFEELKARVPTE